MLLLRRAAEQGARGAGGLGRIAASAASTRRRPQSAAFASGAGKAAADFAAEAIAAADAWPARLSRPPDAPAEYDVIVVGLGAHGSSALFHLAARAAAAAEAAAGASGAPSSSSSSFRVLGIESSPIPGHGLASHGGDTRITRQAYFESPLYVPLLRRSARLTGELEALVRRQLFWRTGVLHAGGRLYEGALAAALEHGVEHEALRAGAGGSSSSGSSGRSGSSGSSGSVEARWPGLRLPSGTPVLWEPGAGVLAPEMMIRSHVAAAVAKGRADVLCGDGAKSWGGGEGGGKGVVVETRGGRAFTARRALVLAAGAWMPVLVPELRGLAVPRRYTVAWLDANVRGGGEGQEGEAAAGRRRAEYAYGALPPFLIEEPGTGVAFYGFPAWPHAGVAKAEGQQTGEDHPDKRHSVKLGAFLPSSGDLSAGGTRDPGAAVERAMQAADEAAVRRFADACFPGLRGGELTGFSACMFTDTPDGHFLIDDHPAFAQGGGGGGGGGNGGGGRGGPRVVLCSACSGHGFKLSPAVGEVLADMALGGDGASGGLYDGAVLALHRLRPERPGVAEVLRRFAASGEPRGAVSE